MTSFGLCGKLEATPGDGETLVRYLLDAAAATGRAMVASQVGHRGAPGRSIVQFGGPPGVKATSETRTWNPCAAYQSTLRGVCVSR